MPDKMLSCITPVKFGKPFIFTGIPGESKGTGLIYNKIGETTPVPFDSPPSPLIRPATNHDALASLAGQTSRTNHCTKTSARLAVRAEVKKTIKNDQIVKHQFDVETPLATRLSEYAIVFRDSFASKCLMSRTRTQTPECLGD